MKSWSRSLMAGLWVGLFPTWALAHVSISTGPGLANTTQEVTFNVGHGCAGVDTKAIRIAIPAGVTSVRALRSDFATPVVEKNGTAVTSVTWTKPDGELLAEDVGYYKLTLRLKLPDAPFTTLFFPVLQTCKTQSGTESTTAWVGTTEGGTEEPAPALRIVPAHGRGWTRFTVSQSLTDLAAYFSDALIVWKGKAAYSPQTTTAELIASTSGVTVLTELSANDEIWVKY